MKLEIQAQLDDNKFWRRISARLQPLIRGLSVEQWMEKIGDQLYEKASHQNDFVDLADYFEILNVDRCTVNVDLAVSAGLHNLGNAFEIVLKATEKDNISYSERFSIAHEMAHIFFYDRSCVPFIDYKLFPIGSAEIEAVCNRIARCILMPDSLMKKKISHLPRPTDPQFSLSQLKHLSLEFKAPFTAILNRMIVDTGIWNCIVLTFVLHRNERDPWKVIYRFFSPQFWKNPKAFIPPEDPRKLKSNPKRYPSAKDGLHGAFEEIYRQALNDQDNSKPHQDFQQCFYSVRLDVAKISASPLEKFFKGYYSQTKELLIHFSITEKKSAPMLNVCIPIPD